MSSPSLNEEAGGIQPRRLTDADHSDDIAILSDHLGDATSLLHSIEKLAKEIGLYVNAEKTEFMCLNQEASAGSMSSLGGEKIKQVDDFNTLAATSPPLNVT